MKQWNEWWFDDAVCISAQQETPESPVRVGWAIRHDVDRRKQNKKKARLIAAGRRDSARAFLLDIPPGASLQDAFNHEILRRWQEATGTVTLSCVQDQQLWQFCNQNRLARWLVSFVLTS